MLLTRHKKSGGYKQRVVVEKSPLHSLILGAGPYRNTLLAKRYFNHLSVFVIESVKADVRESGLPG
jgi:hypothetical protein